MDLFSGAPFGAATMSLVVVGLLAGLGKASTLRSNVALPALVVFLVTIVHNLVSLLVLQISGLNVTWLDSLFRITLPSAALNALLTPPIFVLMRWSYIRFHREEMECNLSEAPAKGTKFRLGAFRAVAAIVFMALIVQLWRLQILEGDQYQAAADVNRFRLESEPAPRGVIYDRRGHLLARNMPQITVSIIPAYLPEDEEERKTLLVKLAKLLEIPAYTRPTASPVQPSPEQDGNPEKGILDIVLEAELAPYRPAPIKTGVSRDMALILEEEHLDWPGVLVQVRGRPGVPARTPHLPHSGLCRANSEAAWQKSMKLLGYNPNQDRGGTCRHRIHL